MIVDESHRADLAQDAAPGWHAYEHLHGPPRAMLAYLVAVAIELGAGALLVVGFQTRIVGIILALFTVATALSFDHNFADQNQMAHFLKNVAITGGLLQVVAFGAGNFSIDGRHTSSRGSSPVSSVPTAA
jgi:putative oxidoreductase